MNEFLMDNFLFLFPVISVIGLAIVAWYIKIDYKSWTKKQEDMK
jgi:hypothetical protein